MLVGKKVRLQPNKSQTQDFSILQERTDSLGTRVLLSTSLFIRIKVSMLLFQI